MGRGKKFFVNGALLCLVGLAGRTVAIILGAFISRTIGAEAVGLNSLVMNIYAFGLTFATAGIQLTVTALVASELAGGKGQGTGKILRGSFAYAIAFSSAATLALLLLSRQLSIWVVGDGGTYFAINILSLSLIPSALSAVISGYFVGMRRVSLNAIVSFIGQAVRVFLTVTLLIKYKNGGTYSAIYALALGVMLTELITFVLSLFELAIDRFEFKYCKSGGVDIKSVSKIALPLALSAYVRQALLTLEHSLIPKRLRLYLNDGGESLAALGYLSGMALPMLLYPMVPLSAFGSLLVPEFAQARASGRIKQMEYIAARTVNMTLTYALTVAFLFFTFSEELGYAVYASHTAGYYIAMLAPVVPIMYLDHVTDNMLKGIGEQVYSMWVNIIDSLLSVFLVFVLLPIFGVSGYAFVIIGMEGFNFLFSSLRLRKRIKFKIDLTRAVLIPLLSVYLSSLLLKYLFKIRGQAVGIYLLFLEGIFVLCMTVAFNLLFRTILLCIHKRASKTTISPNPKSRA